MRHAARISIALAALMAVACTHNSSSNGGPKPNVESGAEADQLVNFINEMGTPEATWPKEKLELFASRLSRLEQLARESKTAASLSFLSRARVQLSEARGATREERVATKADLERGLADLNALGSPKASWTSAQLDLFETQLNKVEVAAKQLGQVQEELKIAEMRAELSDERLSAVRERQSNQLYQQSLEAAQKAEVKCQDLADEAGKKTDAAERSVAMKAAYNCTNDAITVIGQAMVLAKKHGDETLFRTFIDELAGIQGYREQVEQAEHAHLLNTFDKNVSAWFEKFKATFAERHPEAAKSTLDFGKLTKDLAALGTPNTSWSDAQIQTFASALGALKSALSFEQNAEAKGALQRADADLEQLRQTLLENQKKAAALSDAVAKINELKKECQGLRQARIEAKSTPAAVDGEKNCFNRLTMTIESTVDAASSLGDAKATAALREEYRKVLLAN